MVRAECANGDGRRFSDRIPVDWTGYYPKKKG